MKEITTKLLIAAILLVCLSPFLGCELDEGGDVTGEPTSVADTTAETVPDTEGAIDVIALPTESMGLSYISNGDGTCTLTGIGSCTDTAIKIPEKSESGELVTKIAASAFSGNASIVSVSIPASVTEIGIAAFTNCQNLAYIEVDDANTKYTDMGGILYTADGVRLLCLPAGASYISLTLTKKIKQIAESATAGCTTLQKIVYEGSSEDWKTVNVAAGNTPFASASMIFMVTSGK